MKKLIIKYKIAQFLNKSNKYKREIITIYSIKNERFLKELLKDMQKDDYKKELIFTDEQLDDMIKIKETKEKLNINVDKTNLLDCISTMIQTNRKKSLETFFGVYYLQFIFDYVYENKNNLGINEYKVIIDDNLKISNIYFSPILEDLIYYKLSKMNNLNMSDKIELINNIRNLDDNSDFDKVIEHLYSIEDNPDLPISWGLGVRISVESILTMFYNTFVKTILTNVIKPGKSLQ